MAEQSKYAVTDEIIEGHDYDGIQEYDNPLPRWWLWLFYLTTAFGVGYVAYYEFGPGVDQAEAYAMEMEEAKKLYPDQDPSNNKELLAALTNDPAAIEVGKGIYTANCAACHAPDGGGLVGPNLTDEFWLHGKGQMPDIVRVISNGVPEKGMIAWKKTLKPDQIVSVSAYVNTLKGTTPANPKAPQGEKAQ